MLRGGHTVGQAAPTDEDASAPNPLAPLIMFAAGPGTITAVVTLAAVHTPSRFPATAIVASVVGAAATLSAKTANRPAARSGFFRAQRARP